MGEIYEEEYYPEELKKKSSSSAASSSLHFMVSGLRQLSSSFEHLFRSHYDESSTRTGGSSDSTGVGNDRHIMNEYSDQKYYQSSEWGVVDSNSSSMDSFLDELEDDIIEDRDSHKYLLDTLPNRKTAHPVKQLKTSKRRIVTIRKTIDLEIDWEDTIESVLQRIYEQEGIIPTEIHTPCLIYDDEILHTDHFVADYNLSRGDKLQLLIHA